jgi:hypothetical protein
MNRRKRGTYQGHNTLSPPHPHMSLSTPALVCVHPHTFVLPSSVCVPVCAHPCSRPPTSVHHPHMSLSATTLVHIHLHMFVIHGHPHSCPPTHICHPSLSVPALVHVHLHVFVIRACPCLHSPFAHMLMLV